MTKKAASDDDEGPLRTCIGGGGQAHQDELERFVWDERTGLVFDVRKKAPGRGAWVKPAPAFLKKAISGGFARAFKTKVTAPPMDELVAQMTLGIQRRLAEHVTVAIRSRKAWVGATFVDEGMRDDKIALLLVAKDAGESTRKKYLANADRKAIDTFEALSGAELGGFVGKEFVAVLGVSEPAASKVARDIRSLSQLGAIEG